MVNKLPEHVGDLPCLRISFTKKISDFTVEEWSIESKAWTYHDTLDGFGRLLSAMNSIKNIQTRDEEEKRDESIG